MNLSLKAKNRTRCKSGVAATELAVCLPVIVLLVLATIESCTMIFVKQSLTVAAYEGIRRSVEQNAVAEDVRQAARQVLTDRRVEGAEISVTPRNLPALAAGEPIQITVTAPADRNSVLPGSFYRGKTLSATASMIKEF